MKTELKFFNLKFFFFLDIGQYHKIRRKQLFRTILTHLYPLSVHTTHLHVEVGDHPGHVLTVQVVVGAVDVPHTPKTGLRMNIFLNLHITNKYLRTHVHTLHQHMSF